jgi:hypothetical protein
LILDLMAKVRALPCGEETWAVYQEMLLKMNSSNVDDIVAKFNEDSIWADPFFIAEVVASVAGSRRNGPELIELMTKVSETRGYSALLRQVDEIEKLVADPALDDDVANAIARGFGKSMMGTGKCHKFVVAEVRSFIESEACPLGTAVAALRPLMDAIPDPLASHREAVREAATGGRAGLHALSAMHRAKKHDNHGRLRKAVNKTAEIKLSADRVVSAAEALMSAKFGEDAIKRFSVASALTTVFEPLRRSIDVARGFDALDVACAGASVDSALALFGARWRIFRGTGRPPEVDPFAAAVCAQDLTRLKELIGGRKAKEIEVDVEKLPLDLPCPSRGSADLLEVAAAVGGQVLRYVLEFHAWKPDPENDYTLEQAVAFGDPETIRMIWDRMDAEARVKCDGPIVSSIVFHHAEVAKWLVAEHPQWLDLARRLAREKRAFDVLLRLPEGNQELP